MSVRALTWSFSLPLDDMAAKAALHALADHADENGRCWPSMDRLARWAGCNEKTVRRAISRLAAMGAVVREPRSGQTDIYVLQLDWQPEAQPVARNTKDVPVAVRVRVYLRDGHRCVKCGEDDLDKLSIDHVVSRSSGGTNDPSNLQTMCIACNVKKGAGNTTPVPDLGVVTKSAPVRTSGPEGSDFEFRNPSQDGTRTVKNRQKNRQGTTSDERVRLPEDWRPTPDDRDHVIDRGGDPEGSFPRFADYFGEGKGRNEKRTLAGWSRRFRLWCDDDYSRRSPNRQGVRPAGTGSETAAFARAAARLGGG